MQVLVKEQNVPADVGFLGSVNLATENWTQLRSRWEYSHAANALLNFAAVCPLGDRHLEVAMASDHARISTGTFPERQG